MISPAWMSRTAIPMAIGSPYRSHTVGSRNLTTESAGSKRSSTPQRRTSRQSTIGTLATDAGAISAADAPFRRRTTIAPASFAWSSNRVT